jgi:hypothetical protein
MYGRERDKKTGILTKRRICSVNGGVEVEEGSGGGRTSRLRRVKIGDGGGVMRIDGLQSSSKGRANLLASP